MTDQPTCPLEHHHDPERPRRASRGNLCTGHYLGLAEDIAELARLHAVLAAHLVGGESDTGGFVPAIETGINLNRHVLEVRSLIRHQLTSWTLLVLEEGPWQHAPDDDIDAIATWLLSRIDWIADQPWSPDAAAELRTTRSRGRGLIQPNTTYRVELGPCPVLVGEDQARCTGTVFALMRKAASREQLPSLVLCTEHGEDEDDPHTWGPMQWHALGRQMGRSMHDSAAQAFLRAVSGSA